MTPGIEVRVCDITTLAVDAIVNAANERLTPGGGVSGAIHRAAGPGLAEEAAPLAPCPTGEAVITGGHALPAGHVIHTVGPVWQGGAQGEPERLAAAYANALRRAEEHGLASIAFPAISAGIFGYPPDRAARVAVGAVLDTLPATPGIARVIFCCFDEASAAHHRAALSERGIAA